MSAVGRRMIADKLGWAREKGCSDLWTSEEGLIAVERFGDLQILDDMVPEGGYTAFVTDLLGDDAFNLQRLAHQRTTRIVRAGEVYGRIRARLYSRIGKDGRSTQGSSFRFLREKITPLRALDLPQVIRELAMLDKGFIGIVGPTGSGKTTLKDAILEHRFNEVPTHGMIIGDPIEAFQTPRKSYVEHMQIGQDIDSLDAALEIISSARAHVVAAPELFTAEHISLATNLAESGNLVFAEWHAGSCAEGLLRVIDATIGENQTHVRSQFAECFVAIIAVHLVKRSTSRVRAVDNAANVLDPSMVGRRAVVEVMINTPQVQQIIRDPKKMPNLADAIQNGAAYGSITFEQHLKDLKRTEKVAPDAQIVTSPVESLRLTLQRQRGVAG